MTQRTHFWKKVVWAAFMIYYHECCWPLDVSLPFLNEMALKAHNSSSPHRYHEGRALRYFYSRSNNNQPERGFVSTENFRELRRPICARRALDKELFLREKEAPLELLPGDCCCCCCWLDPPSGEGRRFGTELKGTDDAPLECGGATDPWLEDEDRDMLLVERLKNKMNYMMRL